MCIRDRTGTGAGNVLNEPENAGDETTRQGADSSAKKQTGTLDERAVESRLGNAAQRGDAKGGHHALTSRISLDGARKDVYKRQDWFMVMKGRLMTAC